MAARWDLADAWHEGRFAAHVQVVAPTLAAHLTDQVLGGLPVRQWVLTLPHRLRYALAFDHTLCRGALAVFMRALLGLQRRRARKLGGQAGLGGAVTAIQRAGSAANLIGWAHYLALLPR